MQFTMLPQKLGFFSELIFLDKGYVHGLLQMDNMLLELYKDKLEKSERTIALVIDPDKTERAAQVRLQSFGRTHARAPAAEPDAWKGYADATQLGSSVSAAASEAFVQRSISHPLVASFAPGASRVRANSV